MDIVRANYNEGGNNVVREYRKGNWTIQETMVLIEAKKMDEERRTKRQGDSSERGKPAELRWKWVEDYCWKKGCLRSQTQCNDKWDNLMRDFKKIREHEKKVAAGKGNDVDDDDHGGLRGNKSYWNLEKTERKAQNLPSNMLSQLYEALLDAVEKKGRQRLMVAASGGGAAASSSAVLIVNDGGRQPTNLLPFVVQNPVQPPPLLLPLQPPPPPHSALHLHQPLPPVDSDTSHEQSDSPSKRRRRGGEGSSHGGGGGGRGGSGSGGGGGGGGASGGGNDSSNEIVGNAISRSASIIAEAIAASEEREERRHREVMNMQERMLQIEESKAETSRQGINGLVDAVNKLANSILAMASPSHNHNNNNNNNNNNNQTP